METIGERIKHQRAVMKLSRQALADSLDVNYETIRLWELGRAEPRPRDYERLSEALKCDVIWLSLGIESPGASLPPFPDTEAGRLSLEISVLPLTEQIKILQDITRRLEQHISGDHPYTPSPFKKF